MERIEVGKWKSFNFGPEENVSELDVKEKPNISNQGNYRAKHVYCFNFYNKVTPRSVDELAVHSKKIEDVENWLSLNVLNQEMKSPFLLISGPTGSGKTSTIKVLCSKMSISISEWINPIAQDYEAIKGSNQWNRFLEFFTDSKWKSLFENEKIRKISLVKDFPNVILYQPEGFLNILNECNSLKYPIVFICTDSSNNSVNLKTTLFSEEIINKFNITHIRFNTCATSLMKKALKRAESILQENIELFTIPLPSTIDAVLSTAMGDIRNAMNQLYYLCLLGTDDSNTNVSGEKKRKRNSIIRPQQCMARDENLGLFHGLGRVLNTKRIKVYNSWRINCSIEKLVDEFSVQPTVFISFLFENYLKYFGNINDIHNAAQVLSFSIRFIDNCFEKQTATGFGLWISILGLMIYNEHKVSKWNQIRSPPRINICNGKGTTRLHPADYFYYNLINDTNVSYKFKI